MVRRIKWGDRLKNETEKRVGKKFINKYGSEIEADKYKDLIPKKLYDAMYEYEVEWED